MAIGHVASFISKDPFFLDRQCNLEISCALELVKL